MPPRRTRAYVFVERGFFSSFIAELFRQAGITNVCVVDRLAFRYASDASPDLLFIDDALLHAETCSIVTRLRRGAPNAVICLYSWERSFQWSRACFCAGANAVLHKSTPAESLLAAIRTVLLIGSYVDPLLLSEISAPASERP